MDGILKSRAMCLAAAMVFVSSGCADNVTPPLDIAAWDKEDPIVAECFPNLDGVIEASELTPTTGIPVRYRVTATGAPVDVNIAGLRDAAGVRVWDLSQTLSADREVVVSAVDISTRWYASEFPGGMFSTPLDNSGNEEGVYEHRADGLYLHGFASVSEEPVNTRTLMRYTQPVLLYPFPMTLGDEWVSVGQVNNGTFRGLPYAGRDTYSSKVSDQGEVWLPSIRFEDVLQVKTAVQVEPAVGQSTSRVQVSWLFECYGEVMRAVSESGETDLNFTRISELRRLGF